MRSGGVVRALVLASALLFVAPRAEGALAVELVTDDLFRPVFVASPPGDANRLFIVEQHPRPGQTTARILIYDRSTGSLLPTPFLVPPQIRTGNEQGLLGLAFHPGYRTNGYFYINLTPSGGSSRTEVVRYRAEGDPVTSNTADPESRVVILTFAQPESNHNGGWMGFGPDGYLYISTGDGGGGDDRHGAIGNAQNRARGNLLGKLLRIDVDAGMPYGIPDGNPYKGHASFAEEIWAFGLRNPWRCSFDRETGDLWIGDVGQGAQEEIDVIPNGTAGLNFGWRPREGLIQNPRYPNETPVTTAVNPVSAYPRSLGYSVTGGYVYRGSNVPELRGKYVFADYGSARIWTLSTNDAGTYVRTEISTDINPSPRQVTSISSFGEDSAGELYICDLDGLDGASGAVFRIVAEGPRVPQISAVEMLATGQFVIRFNAAAGQSYALESRSSLASGVAWLDEETIASAATNRTISITNELTGAERYFRLSSE